MLKGFKDFILKGNVVELATAVIIGAAFSAIVTAFTTSIISPLFAAIPTGSCGDASTATVGEGADAVTAPIQSCPFGVTLVEGNDATFMDFGALLTAIINFLIIAAVVYFLIIAPYNKLSELGGFGKKSEVTEISLLTEIRDLLDPEGTSKAKEAAEAELPDHVVNDDPPANDGPSDPGTQRIAAPAAYDPLTSPTPPTPQGYAPPAGPGGYPTQGAPGNYPPPQGGYPQGQFPPAHYPDPNDPLDGPGRHSR